jgi:aminomethyltransferase
MVPFSGWHMPVQYEGITAEHQAVRTRAGLFDVSHMGELLLTGEGAAAFVNRLVTNDLSRIEAGRAMYTCCCNDSGGILDDLIVYKRSDTDVLVVCNAGNRDKISSYFAERAAGACGFSDASDDFALLALQGPRALEILVAAGSSISDPAKSLGSFRFREGSVGGVRTTIARTGYTGEDGVELFCASGDAPALWRALLAAGKSFGLSPAGLGARDTLRLEARLSLYGNDIDETTNPIEAGLSWTVKLDGPDFVGKEALERIKAEGPKRRLVGFEMTERGIARHGYPLVDVAGTTIGICTSGSPSPTLGKNIGLGYLPAPMAEIGTQFGVDCRGKRVGAVVVNTPFYKRPKP